MRPDGTDLIDVIRATVRDEMATSDTRSRIELVKFSGKEDDVIRPADGSKIYLRCTSERRRDGDGYPTPMVLRLASVGGHWTIPTVVTELIGVIPEDVGQAVGAGYVLALDPTPPAKLASDASYTEHSTGTTIGQVAGGFVWKAKSVTMSLDKDTGAFTVAWQTGTRLEMTGSLFRVVLANETTGIACVFQIDSTGIAMSAGAAGVSKVTAKFDAANGQFRSAGIGAFVARHIQTMLGLAPVMPAAYPAGVTAAPSTTTFITP